MASTIICIAAASLALAPQVAAKGRGGGGGGGDGGSGQKTMNMDELIQVGPWKIARRWVIIGGVVIGIVVLFIVSIVLQMCGIFKKLVNLRIDTQKARQQQEAHLMESAKGGGVAHPEQADSSWVAIWEVGPPQHYVQIQPEHGHTPSAWITDSQQQLPYSQGGLGHTQHSDNSVYHPPNIHVVYSIPYDPPRH